MQTPVLATPASLELHPNLGMQDAEKAFALLYPSWSTWKFRRTLSYWVGVLYCEGSILFTLGAGFSLFRKTDDLGMVSGYSEPWGLVAVDGPYFVGGICFTIGSWFGVLKLINVGNEGSMKFMIHGRAHWRQLKQYVSAEAIFIYVGYLIGALFFNVMTITPYVPALHKCCAYWTVHFTALIGGFMFAVAGFIEFLHNDGFKFRLKSIYWWSAFLNFVGGVLFLVAGLGYMFNVSDGKTWSEQTSFWVICCTYFVGSSLYWVGSFLALLLWKDEQFGLTAAPELNTGERRQEPLHEEVAMHRQYGCGPADKWQLPWLMLYLINASASVLNVGFTLLYHTGSEPHLDFLQDMLQSSLMFCLSHGIMLLGSVIHHTPTARPFNWLLNFMRVLLLFICVNAWVLVAKNMLQHWDCVFLESACPGHHE